MSLHKVNVSIINYTRYLRDLNDKTPGLFVSINENVPIMIQITENGAKLHKACTNACHKENRSPAVKKIKTCFIINLHG